MDKIPGIDSEQFKLEWCSIKEDECDGIYCNTCETALTDLTDSTKEDKKIELKQYTVFDIPCKISGINDIMRNCDNTIAKPNEEQYLALVKAGVVVTNEIPYTPDRLKNWSIKVRKLRKYNSLGIPDKILGKPNYLAAFVFGDVYYLIAPRTDPNEVYL